MQVRARIHDMRDNMRIELHGHGIHARETDTVYMQGRGHSDD